MALASVGCLCRQFELLSLVYVRVKLDASIVINFALDYNLVYESLCFVQLKI